MPFTTKPLSRRSLLAGASTVGAAALASHLPAPAVARTQTIKIGFVTPQTGPLAPFAAADQFILNDVAKMLNDGVMIGGRKVPVEVIVKDSQSNPSRAAERSGAA